MRYSWIVLAAVLAGGCATHGQEIKSGQVDQIREGVTTRDDLIASFGQPVTRTRTSDGGEILGWGYAKVGFAGSSYKSQGLSAVLGPDGKVTSYSVTDTGKP